MFPLFISQCLLPIVYCLLPIVHCTFCFVFSCGLLFPLPNSTIPSACDAEGKHPCCSEHTWWCGHSVHHCTNAKSTDFSKLVSSNEAVWQQAANECKVGDISRQEACDMLNLNQMTLIFIGTSLWLRLCFAKDLLDFFMI